MNARLLQIKALFVIVLLGSFWGANAQSVAYTIRNDVQTSDRTLEFDLYVLNTSPDIPVELSGIQAGISVNPAIAAGGTIIATIVPGSSELEPIEQPTAIMYASNCIKIATRPNPGQGKGSLLSTKAPGTRYCRIKLTNTVPFAADKANLIFNIPGRTKLYPAKLSHYVGIYSVPLSTDIIDFSNATNNPILKVTTGLEDTKALTLLLYPNPATDSFMINVGDQATVVSIYDLTGALVLSQDVVGAGSINIRFLPKGTYQVKANGLVNKLIKK